MSTSTEIDRVIKGFYCIAKWGIHWTDNVLINKYIFFTAEIHTDHILVHIWLHVIIPNAGTTLITQTMQTIMLGHLVPWAFNNNFGSNTIWTNRMSIDWQKCRTLRTTARYENKSKYKSKIYLHLIMTWVINLLLPWHHQVLIVGYFHLPFVWCYPWYKTEVDFTQCNKISSPVIVIQITTTREIFPVENTLAIVLVELYA